MQLPLNDDVVGQFSAELTAGSSRQMRAAVAVNSPEDKKRFSADFRSVKNLCVRSQAVTADAFQSHEIPYPSPQMDAYWPG